MKLQTILERCNGPQERLNARRTRTKAILESRAPQSGAYWWVPTPDGSWYLETFFDSEFAGNTMHDFIWRRYMMDVLGVLWNKDPRKLARVIGDEYTGLPRGRVNKVGNGFTVVHGGDAPVRNAEDKIISTFNLYRAYKDGNVKFMDDEHETMMAGDPEAVQQALGVDLGLSGSFHPDFADDTY